MIVGLRTLLLSCHMNVSRDIFITFAITITISIHIYEKETYCDGGCPSYYGSRKCPV